MGTTPPAARTAAIAIEAKRAERQERLLVEELSNRVKNTIATAQSLATQTLRGSASPERFAAAFSGRLAALAKAHTLLANHGWTGAGLHDRRHPLGEPRVGHTDDDDV